MLCHKLIILKRLVKVIIMAYTEGKRVNGGEHAAVSTRGKKTQLTFTVIFKLAS